MKKLLLIIFIFIFLKSNGQSGFSSSNYIVTGKDLETNTFEKDTTANALVIYEFGKSYIDKNTFNLKFEFKQKLKILNRKGFDNAIITIYLYNNDKQKEKVSNIIATTHNLVNGDVEKIILNKNAVFEEKYNDNYTLVKFTLPSIQVGSVITYSYTLESPFIYKYKGWEFQDDIPKLYSEYQTSIPAIYEYNIKLVGSLPLIKNEAERKYRCIEGGGGTFADCFEAVYAMEDIPAFIEEDYMTTKENYLASINYELKTIKRFDGSIENITKSWDYADKELKNDENIGRQLNKNVSSYVTISDSVINEKDLLKRAKGIYEYIQSNFTWNEKYGIFNEVSVKDLAKSRSGNVSEINIFLHNLLEEYGIPVSPILISTRNNGFPTKIYPVISDFNYLIVQVSIGNNTYFLDATDNYLSFGELPFRCLNQYGRKLDFKNGSDWVEIFPAKTSTIQYKVELSLESDEQITGTLNSLSTGYHALSQKKSYFPNPQEHLKYYKNKYQQIEIKNHSVDTKSETSFDFSEEFEIALIPESIGGNIYLDPFVFKFFEENPFKLQERTYPIDFGYKDAYLYNFKINLNDAYEVVELPKQQTFALPGNSGQVIFNTIKEGTNVLVYFKIAFNSEVYEPEYYKYLKEFMASVVNIQKNSIIIIKKK